eukprot:SAG31_NODE_3102_length_4673_cov_2.821382_1_plen_84_part_00
MAYALFTLPLLLPAAIGGDANVSEGGDTRDTSTDRSIDSSAGSESAFLSSTGWHGPINVECKGCYFLVFVPTVREIRDLYREM